MLENPLSSIPSTPAAPARRSMPVAMLLSPADMQANLQACLPAFGDIAWVERTGSTNADLYAQARQSRSTAARPWLLGAHLQDHGRGRSGRTWQNRRGANLMFSCAFDVFLAPRQLPALAPLAGLAACEALRRMLPPPHRDHLTMKWPNDLQWQSAKLAGILVEVTRAGTARLSTDHHVAIIGMGINLEDARALSQSLNRRVADWSQIAALDASAAAISAANLVNRIAQAWYTGINHASTHGFEDFPARYAAVDALSGQHVQIIDNGKLTQAGVAHGINHQGQLQLRTPQGDQSVTVGEVSVRPQKTSWLP